MENIYFGMNSTFFFFYRQYNKRSISQRTATFEGINMILVRIIGSGMWLKLGTRQMSIDNKIYLKLSMIQWKLDQVLKEHLVQIGKKDKKHWI